MFTKFIPDCGKCRGVFPGHPWGHAGSTHFCWCPQERGVWLHLREDGCRAAIVCDVADAAKAATRYLLTSASLLPSSEMERGEYGNSDRDPRRCYRWVCPRHEHVLSWWIGMSRDRTPRPVRVGFLSLEYQPEARPKLHPWPHNRLY